MVWLGQLFVSSLVPIFSLRACWAGCCHEMVWLGQPFVSLLISSSACWAGCCHEMVWLGQLFVSPCFHLSLSTRACWVGCCHEMVWLGQLFVSPLVPFVSSRASWAGCCHEMVSVSSVCPHLFAFVSPLVSSRTCWAECCHEMVWLGQPFVFQLFPFVFPLVFSRACWAECCHEMVWLGEPQRGYGGAGPDMRGFQLGAIFSMSSFVLVLHQTGWFLRCQQLVFSVSLLGFAERKPSKQLAAGGSIFTAPKAASAVCLLTCFLTRLLGRMLSRDGLARSALCFPTCFLTRLLGWMLSQDGLARWSGSVSPLSPHLFQFVSPLVFSRACWALQTCWEALTSCSPQRLRKLLQVAVKLGNDSLRTAPDAIEPDSHCLGLTMV